MKSRKIVLVFLLAVLTVFAVFPSSRQETQAPAPAGGPVTISVFSAAGPYTKDGANNYFWRRMEEVTGVKAIVEVVPQISFTEQVNLRWSSNSLADVLFKGGIDVAGFANDGAIVPIEPYFAQWAPNLSRYMAENADIERNIRLADGHIYGFPYLVTASTTTPKLFYNKKWLDSTGRPVPTTTEELKTLAQLFYDSDWNKNGQQDEIPIHSEYPSVLYRAFYGAFGMRTGGNYREIFDIDESGNMYYIWASDKGRNMLQYLNDLYTKRLIGQEFFTVDIPKFTADANQNRIAFAFIGNSMYLDQFQGDFAALPGPFKGPQGFQNYTGFDNYVNIAGGFITTKNKFPGESVKWIDYLYSDEGICLYFMGEKDVTYYIDENGDPQFTDYVRNNPNGIGMEEALGSYVIWSGGGNPTVADAKHFANHLLPPITSESIEILAPYRPATILGNFQFVQEDQERLSMLSADINTYMAEMRAKFIRGEESFNNWNAYVQTLESMGLREYLDIMQRGYEAYSK